MYKARLYKGFRVTVCYIFGKSNSKGIFQNSKFLDWKFPYYYFLKSGSKLDVVKVCRVDMWYGKLGMILE